MPEIKVVEMPGRDASTPCEHCQEPGHLVIPDIFAYCKEHTSEYTHMLKDLVGMPNDADVVHVIVEPGSSSPRWKPYRVHYFGIPTDIDPASLDDDRLRELDLPQLIFFYPVGDSFEEGIRILQTWRRAVYWVGAPGHLEDRWRPGIGHTAPAVMHLLPTLHSSQQINAALDLAKDAFQLILYMRQKVQRVGRPTGTALSRNQLIQRSREHGSGLNHEPPSYLPLRHLADIYGISERTLRRYIKESRLVTHEELMSAILSGFVSASAYICPSGTRDNGDVHQEGVSRWHVSDSTSERSRFSG